MRMILLSADIHRLHFALSTAAAACAFDRPVLLFISGEAVTSPLFRSNHDEDAKLRAFAKHATTCGVASPRALLDICLEFGAKIWVCEAALRLANMTLDQIDPMLHATPGGIAGLLHEEGELMTF